MIVLDPKFVPWHRIFLKAGLAFAGNAMELPVVPWADDVIAFQLPLAQRTTNVIANAGHNADLAISHGHRDFYAS